MELINSFIQGYGEHWLFWSLCILIMILGHVGNRIQKQEDIEKAIRNAERGEKHD